jgi:hypothetical protein
MFALMEGHYQGVAWDSFVRDLERKDDVFLFRCGGRLIGFSTIVCRRMPHLADATFLFSGDTVIDREYWGRSFLQICFGRYVLAKKLQRPHRPLYWMLISKGYKTYMMMRRNYPRSFPQPDRPTPPAIQRVLDGFYGERFGGAFDPVSGLIRIPEGNYVVREEWAEPPAGLHADPEVRHFMARNPQAREGVELACLAEIRLRDYIPIFLKYTPRYLRLVKKK